MKPLKNQRGALDMILGVFVFVLLVGAGYVYYHSHHKKVASSSTGVTASTAPTSSTTAPKSTVSTAVIVKTTDGHVQFSLPTSWEVTVRKDGGSNCGFVSEGSDQGTCLLDVTYQPTAFNANGKTYWNTRVFQTTKSPQTWNADVIGTGAGSCDNPRQGTINGYQELICTYSAGGTEYVISNGQYLAYFVDPGTDTGSFANAIVASYEPDVKTIVNSIKFN